MGNTLKTIQQLIPTLPLKDYHLARKFLENRDFQSLLEIVDSDIYKAEKSRPDNDEEPNDYIISLTELREQLLTYMSYLDIPDNSNDYDY